MSWKNLDAILALLSLAVAVALGYIDASVRRVKVANACMVSVRCQRPSSDISYTRPLHDIFPPAPVCHSSYSNKWLFPRKREGKNRFRAQSRAEGKNSEPQANLDRCFSPRARACQQCVHNDAVHLHAKPFNRAVLLIVLPKIRSPNPPYPTR